MEKLRHFLNSMSRAQQVKFAGEVGTSINYLRKAISVRAKMDAGLVVRIEQASGGAVRCEDLRPDVDWAVLRGTCVAREHNDEAA